MGVMENIMDKKKSFLIFLDCVIRSKWPNAFFIIYVYKGFIICVSLFLQFSFIFIFNRALTYFPTESGRWRWLSDHRGRSLCGKSYTKRTPSLR